MTDTEKIEKLAKWMGIQYEKLSTGQIIINGKVWNPLTNIADAWMLVEKYQEWYKADGGHTISPPYHVFEGITQDKATEAARAISEAVLEVID